MPTLNIGGHSVAVDDGFLSLSPEQQNATVDEIARTLTPAAAPSGGGGSPMMSAITDVPGEIYGAGKSAFDTMAENLNPFSDKRRAAIEQQANEPSMLKRLGQSAQQVLATGSGLAAAPALVGAPITGAARSLIGHPYASLTGMPYEQAKDAVDTAMMALKPTAANPRGLVTKPAPIPIALELKNDARSVYNDPAIKNAPISNADATALASAAENDLLQSGFRPTTGSAPGTFAEVKRMTPDPNAPSVTVDDLRAARRALNMTAKERTPIGEFTPDAVAARSVIVKIDGVLDTVSPKLREANANYSAAKSADLLDFRAMNAEHRAAKTGSGSNIENTMRQEVDKIPDRGLTAQEQALRDQIVEGTATRNTLRKMGKLGFGDGLSMMLHAGLAVPSAGANLPVGIAATIARKIGETLTARQIRELNEMIRSRTPLAQSRPLTQLPAPSRRVYAAALAAGLVPGMQGDAKTALGRGLLSR